LSVVVVVVVVLANRKEGEGAGSCFFPSFVVLFLTHQLQLAIDAELLHMLPRPYFNARDPIFVFSIFAFFNRIKGIFIYRYCFFR
jgi:hypothetical protein